MSSGFMFIQGNSAEKLLIPVIAQLSILQNSVMVKSMYVLWTLHVLYDCLHLLVFIISSYILNHN